MGKKWKVQGNEVEAMRLVGFLRNCRSLNIIPTSPIRYEDGKRLRLQNLRCGANDSWYKNMEFNLPKKWGEDNHGDFFCYLSSVSTPEEGKGQLIKALKGLDSKAYAFPQLIRLQDIPAMIFNGTAMISEGLEKKAESDNFSLLQVFEQRPEIFNINPGNKIPPSTLEVLSLSLPFKYSEEKGLVYNGTYKVEKGKPSITDVEISVEGDVILDENVLRQIPWEREYMNFCFPRDERGVSLEEGQLKSQDCRLFYELSRTEDGGLDISGSQRDISDPTAGTYYDPRDSSRQEKLSEIHKIACWFMKHNMAGKEEEQEVVKEEPIKKVEKPKPTKQEPVKQENSIIPKPK